MIDLLQNAKHAFITKYIDGAQDELRACPSTGTKHVLMSCDLPPQYV